MTSPQYMPILNQLDSVYERLKILFDEIGFTHSDREDRIRKVCSVVSDALESYLSQIKAERDELKHQCETKQHEIESMANAIPDFDFSQIQICFSSLPLSSSKLSDQKLESKVNSTLGFGTTIQPPYLSAYNVLSETSTKIKNVYDERAAVAQNIYSKLQDLNQRLNGSTSTTESDNDVDRNQSENNNDRKLLNYRVNINPDYVNPELTKKAKFSLDHLAQIDIETQKLQNELQNRISQISVTSAQIVALWAELGSPQTEIDSNIMTNYKTDPEKIGTTPSDMVCLYNLVDSLTAEKERRTERIATLSENIYKLWEKLDEDEDYKTNFEYANRGLGLVALETIEKEHERLVQKKKENVGVFIHHARNQLEQLWDKLYFSEKETYSFTPAWADIFTDASLEAHEAEIERLEKLLIERMPIIKLIDQYRDLQNEENELLNSTQDASRLLHNKGAGGATPKRDPSRLLREEQMRKRISKRKPKVMQDLKAGLDDWLEKTGEPFYIHGEDFSKVLADEISKTIPSSRYGKVKPAKSLSQMKSFPSSPKKEKENGNLLRRGSVSGDLLSRPSSRFAGDNPSPTKSSLLSEPKSNLSSTFLPLSKSSKKSVLSNQSLLGRPVSPIKPSSFGSKQPSAGSPNKPMYSDRRSPVDFGQLSSNRKAVEASTTSNFSSLTRSATPTRQLLSGSPTRTQQPVSSSPLRQSSPTNSLSFRSATSLGMRSSPTRKPSLGHNIPSLSHPARSQSGLGHRSVASIGSIPITATSPTRPNSMMSKHSIPSNKFSNRNSMFLEHSNEILINGSQRTNENMTTRSRSELENRLEFEQPNFKPNQIQKASTDLHAVTNTPKKETNKYVQRYFESLGSPVSRSALSKPGTLKYMDSDKTNRQNIGNCDSRTNKREVSVGSNKENPSEEKSQQKFFAPRLNDLDYKMDLKQRNRINVDIKNRSEDSMVHVEHNHENNNAKPFDTNPELPYEKTNNLDNKKVSHSIHGINPLSSFSNKNELQSNTNYNQLAQDQKYLKTIQYMQKSQRALQRLHNEAMAKVQNGQPAFEDPMFEITHGSFFTNAATGMSFGTNSYGRNNTGNAAMAISNDTKKSFRHSVQYPVGDNYQTFNSFNGLNNPVAGNDMSRNMNNQIGRSMNDNVLQPSIKGLNFGNFQNSISQNEPLHQQMSSNGQIYYIDSFPRTMGTPALSEKLLVENVDGCEPSMVNGSNFNKQGLNIDMELNLEQSTGIRRKKRHSEFSWEKDTF